MTQVILPTAYLPPVSWWAVAVKSGDILLEYNETYPKQTYRNRCHIYGANGLLSLSIPVIKVNGNHTLTSEIRIDNSKNWQLVHWRSIESAYNNTPYFLFYKDILEPIFYKKYNSLVEFNIDILLIIARIINRKDIRFNVTSKYEPLIQPDFRFLIHPKKPPASFGLVNFPRYIQAFEPMYGFLPDLSIIDLLFNEGAGSAEYLRNLKLNGTTSIDENVNSPDIQS